MRKVWLAALALVFAVAGIHLATRKGPGEWTSSSPEALAEFERALDAEVKFYRSDAVRHLRRALELDPDFVAPKLWLQYFPDLVNEKDREQLFEELRHADLEQLTARERFILGYRLANRERDFERAEKVLQAYLKDHPEDPWALRFVVARAWNRREWAEAERLYKQLIELDPNWVLAHNHLGYIYMAQGRFRESEEAFRTYRFIAPDQANPHDSLGELLTLEGRYEEAKAELEAAITLRADFCASYEHLATLYQLWQQPEKADAIAARLSEVEGCSEDLVAALACRNAVWAQAHERDWEGAWEASERCPPGYADPVLRHLAAVATGRFAAAEEIEATLEASAKKVRFEDEKTRPLGVHAHLTGARLLRQGRPAEAVAAFERCDELLQFWTDEGILKLYNLTQLATARLAAGQNEAARAALARVREVNARFAPVFLPPDVYAQLAAGGEDRTAELAPAAGGPGGS